jgi:hypothetical protein
MKNADETRVAADELLRRSSNLLESRTRGVEYITWIRDCEDLREDIEQYFREQE